MSNRKIKFILDNETSTDRLINKDLPQGGVLSPTLYALYIKNVLKAVYCQIMGLQYADDIVIINKGQDINQVSRNISQAYRENREN